MTTKKQDACDHKFVGSRNCLKCGWTPSAAVFAARLNPMHVVPDAAPSPEERAEQASRRFSTDRTDRAIFKAGYLAALKEKP